MKRLTLDFALALAMAVVPRLLNTGYEAGRLLALAVVVAGISLLGYFRMLTPPGRRTADLVLAATLLAVAWLESFPAGDHSAPIGFYILFGAFALILGLAAIEERPRDLSPHRAGGDLEPVS